MSHIDTESNTAEARRRQPSPSLKPIRAELSGSDTATAFGVTARAPAPVLALCRRLVAAGHDPEARLEAYRGDVMCLRVRAIGEAAELEINGTGTDLIRRAARRRAAPPIAPIGLEVVGPGGALC